MILIYRTSLIFYFLFLFSGCFFQSEDYLDVEYYSPQILPDENTIITLKYVRKYSETGTPGGINTDEIASRWYLVEYKIAERSTSQRQLYINALAPSARITSASESYVLILTDFKEFLLNINNLAITELMHDLEIEDAHLEINSNQIIILEGFLDYFIHTYDIADGDIKKSIPLDSYYDNIAPSFVTEPDYYLVWRWKEFAIIDPNEGEERLYAGEINHGLLYNKDKVAILNSTNQLEFFKITAESLTKEYSLELQYENAVNFSLSRSLNYLVYQTRSFPHWGKVILRDMNSRSERILFNYEHIDI
jgi:hypothetical protein